MIYNFFDFIWIVWIRKRDRFSVCFFFYDVVFINVVNFIVINRFVLFVMIMMIFIILKWVVVIFFLKRILRIIEDKIDFK